MTTVNLLGLRESPNDRSTAASPRCRPSPRLSLGHAIAGAGARAAALIAELEARSPVLDDPPPPAANDTDVVSPLPHQPAEPPPPSPTPPDRTRPQLVFGGGPSPPPPLPPTP